MRFLQFFFKGLQSQFLPTCDEKVVDKYRYWRMRIFYGMYVGYAFYYLTRKSFTFAMPSMIQDLGFTKGDLGILATIFSVVYAVSKFISGMFADRVNPRYFMSVGLILTGVCNILFGLNSSIIFLILFWGLNGWFQGFGWPPCARLLSYWYAQSERGRWWGLWNTSHNVGGALIPIIVAYIAQSYGWRSAMYAPGICCIGIGFFLMNRLRDTPKSLGLPVIEDCIHDQEAPPQSDEKGVSAFQMLSHYVLKNPAIWLLAIAYFFIYIIRTAVNDWGPLFLIEFKGFSKVAAGWSISCFEIGGFFGSLAAGWSSDKIFKGNRGPINALFSIGVVGAIIVLYLVPNFSYIFSAAVMFAVGFLIFGPQMLMGIAAAEMAHKRAAGAATGFIGWFAYIGSAVAGFPIIKVAQEYGWSAFLLVIVGCGCVASALLLPLWSAKQRTIATPS